MQSGAEWGKISEHSDRTKVKLSDEEQRWSLLAVERRWQQGQPEEGISEWCLVKGEKKQPEGKVLLGKVPCGEDEPQV